MKAKEDIEKLIEETDKLIENGLQIMAEEGKIINLDEWVTAKNYAKMFGLKNENVVVNWINRGIIPPENVIRIKKLNDIRLVKAVPYKETAGV